MRQKLPERLPGASKKVTPPLRALERDGVVARRLFPEVPARVEYSLTPLGWTITEPLVALAERAGARERGHEGAADASLNRATGNKPTS